MNPSDLNFAFFGTPEFSVTILDELEKAGFLPRVVVATPDKPQGRHLVLTPPPVKVWAETRGIPVLQPTMLKTDEFTANLHAYEPDGGWDIFAVAAYGKIIPQNVLDIPKRGVLNVHPSLLPKLRGASPIESAILAEDETGVTIMRLDAEMDHGPIVAQAKADISDWPPKASELEKLLAHQGGKLLAETLPPWVEGSIVETEQNHERATYCAKIAKEDGLIDLADDPETNFRKIRAYETWPGAYFFIKKKDSDGKPSGKPIRVVIKDAEFVSGELRILRIVPEGKKEMNYEDFMRNFSA